MSSSLRSPFSAASLWLGIMACTAVFLAQPVSGAAAPLPQGTLYRVYVTDVRDVQFVVSWTTSTASDGRVEWGTTTVLDSITWDSVSSTTMHYVRLTGLSSSTTYFFQVRSGTQVANNGGSYYTVTTGPTLSVPPAGKLVYDYVYQAGGTTPTSNVVVYLKIKGANGEGSSGNSQLVTARTDAPGVWFFSNLYDVRTADAGAYFTFSDSADNVLRYVQGGSLGTARWVGVGPVPGTYPARMRSLTLDNAPTTIALTEIQAQTPVNWPVLATLLAAAMILISGAVFVGKRRRAVSPRKT